MKTATATTISIFYLAVSYSPLVYKKHYLENTHIFILSKVAILNKTRNNIEGKIPNN
jgi:hypothetical protein